MMVVVKSITLLLLVHCVFGQQQSRTPTSLKHVPPRCREGHYFVPPVAVGSGESRSICKKYGGRLASINIDNFELTTSLLFDCAGPQQRAWIRAWNGLDYNLKCLALYTGTSEPGGGVDTSCLSKKLPSLCVDPTGSYATPPEDDNVISVVTTTVDHRIEESSASDEAEQVSGLIRDSLGWLVDVQNSMYEYRMNPDIN